MSKHTAEPWTDRRIGKEGDGSPRSQHEQLCNDKGVAVFMLEHDGSEAANANVERAMACVDACERIDHPEGIPDLLAAAVTYFAILDNREYTGIPDTLVDAAREKIRTALKVMHG